MIYRHLGKSGLQVSALSLGSWAGRIHYVRDRSRLLVTTQDRAFVVSVTLPAEGR